MGLLERTIKDISPQDSASREAAKQRLDILAVPYWALGDLMDLSIDIAGMMRTITPVIRKKTIVTMAADHGVVAEGVSKFPSEVTQQMVYNFVNGGAGINALAKQAQGMFTKFHQHLKKYESHRICECGACQSAGKLTLKIIAHAGEGS